MGSAADVGEEHDIIESEKPRVDLRLPLVDVKAGGAEPAGDEGGGQGVLVDDRPPGQVDKDGIRLHEGQFFG